MTFRHRRSLKMKATLKLVLVTGLVACALVGVRAQSKAQKTPVPIPNPGVPQIMTLETGMTVREGRPAYKLERAGITLSTPGGGTVPLATQAEYTVTDLRGIE